MKPQKKASFRRYFPTAVYLLSALFLLPGYALMYGDGSDFQHFRPEIFSPLRIRTAPLLCLAGYLLIPCGIMFSTHDNT